MFTEYRWPELTVVLLSKEGHTTGLMISNRLGLTQNYLRDAHHTVELDFASLLLLVFVPVLRACIGLSKS